MTRIRGGWVFILSAAALAWFVSAEGPSQGQSAERSVADRNSRTSVNRSSTGQAASPGVAANAAVPELLTGAPIEMKRLAWLVGEWKTKENYKPGPLASAGGAGSGIETVRIGPGGLSLLSDYEGHGPQGMMTGHGVIAYDRETGGYKISQSDNKTPSGSLFNGLGDWDSETLAFTGTLKLNGKELAMKEIFYNIGPGSFSALLYLGEKPTKLEPILAIEYVKVQPPKGAKP